MRVIQRTKKDGSLGPLNINLNPVEVEKFVLMLDDAIPTLVGEEEEIAMQLRREVVAQRKGLA